MLLRKIDYYGQCILGILMVVSLPVLYIYGFMAGLFLLGCWQLLSAAANTFSFLAQRHGRQICNYWRFTGIVMALLFLCIPLGRMFDPDDVQVLGGISILASIPLGVYYLKIYRGLIDHIHLRDELQGFIR